MEDVSGLVDKSTEFGNFLTAARKFNFTVVYVFHTMYPSKQNWQMIISQTKILKIFPGSIQVSAVSKNTDNKLSKMHLSVYPSERTLVK